MLSIGDEGDEYNQYNILKGSNEMTNRFKKLNLADRVPEELWIKVCNIVQEAVTKTISKKKEVQEGRVVVRGSFTNS